MHGMRMAELPEIERLREVFGERCKAFDAESDRLRSELTAAQTRIGDLKGRVRFEQDRATELESELKTAMAADYSQDAEIERLKKQIVALEAELFAIEAELPECHTSSRPLHLHVKELKAERDGLAQLLTEERANELRRNLVRWGELRADLYRYAERPTPCLGDQCDGCDVCQPADAPPALDATADALRGLVEAGVRIEECYSGYGMLTAERVAALREALHVAIPALAALDREGGGR